MAGEQATMQVLALWCRMHSQDAAGEIERLRAIVRELYEPACAEMGPACEDIAKDYPDVLQRALNNG